MSTSTGTLPWEAETLDRPLGRHFTLELYGCPADLLDDPGRLRRILEEAARRANSTLVQSLVHRFEAQGVTAVGVLSESHIAIHTWPEHRFAAVDVFTCGEAATPDRACAYLIEELRAGYYSYQQLNRGFCYRGEG